MTIIIRDLQDDRSPINDTVDGVDEVLRLLESAAERPPFFCALESSGYTLLVGVGGGVGCAQHSSADRRPPYFMALSSEREHTDEFCQFLSGGQSSDVPRRYCLPWIKLLPIVAFFVKNGGERDPTIDWEEI